MAFVSSSTPFFYAADLVERIQIGFRRLACQKSEGIGDRKNSAFLFLFLINQVQTEKIFRFFSVRVRKEDLPNLRCVLVHPGCRWLRYFSRGSEVKHGTAIIPRG